MKKILIISIFLIIANSNAQDNRWNIILSDGIVFRNISFVSLQKDTLKISTLDKIPVEKIVVIKSTDVSLINEWTFIGGLAGIAIGKSAKVSNKGFTFFESLGNIVIGATVGTLVGGIIGQGSGKKEYNLSQNDKKSRISLIQDLIDKGN